MNNNINNNFIKRKSEIFPSLNTKVFFDELNEMDFNEEEEIFLTIKKMKDNFTLIDTKDFDVKLEEEKLKCKFLILKILSVSPPSKLFSQ